MSNLPHNKAFSATKVRVAFECPRLFYLNHNFGGKIMFNSSSNLLGIGIIFHELSEKFVSVALLDSRFQELLSPPPEQLKPDIVAEEMQFLFYELVFYPYIKESISDIQQKSHVVQEVWKALTQMIKKWAELLINNRSYCPPEKLLRKTFIAQELNIQYCFTLPNGEPQLVKGKFDSLIYDFAKHRLCMVEYKTYNSPDKASQLIQVAIYSYMLREKLGVPVNSAVLSVLPQWQELVFSWDRLEKTVNKIIPYKLQQMQEWVRWKPKTPQPPPPTTKTQLCEICPQKQKCQTYF